MQKFIPTFHIELRNRIRFMDQQKLPLNLSSPDRVKREFFDSLQDHRKIFRTTGSSLPTENCAAKPVKSPARTPEIMRTGR